MSSSLICRKFVHTSTVTAAEAHKIFYSIVGCFNEIITQNVSLHTYGICIITCKIFNAKHDDINYFRLNHMRVKFNRETLCAAYEVLIPRHNPYFHFHSSNGSHNMTILNRRRRRHRYVE